MNKCIDNIIFDLGGVLYDIEYEKTFKELGTLLGFSLEINKWPPKFIKLVHAYETGSINTETFLWNLQLMSASRVPLPRKLIIAWNEMLIGLHEGTFKTLQKLNEDYKLFLLSNNNELHYQYFIRSFNEPTDIDRFYALFEGVCFSHLIGLKKPDIKAYKYVLDKYNLDASKTLFIDDDETNTKAAHNLGVHTVHHHRKNSINNEVFSYLRLVC